MHTRQSAFTPQNKIATNGNWKINEKEKLARPDTPVAAKRAMVRVFRARSFWRGAEREQSMQAYREAMVLWFEADEQQPGLWAEELHLTNMEYASLLLGK